MIETLILYPIITFVITVLLMFADWFLSMLQQNAMNKFYSSHYQSYPINSIEGNPILLNDVKKNKYFSIKHFLVSILVGLFVCIFMRIIAEDYRVLFVGYIWGLFLIVNTQHISNLIGYYAGKRGVHGKIFMHQRTGLVTQSGRYFATSIFLLIISLLVGSVFLYGITIAAFTSSLRQLIWLKKIPKISDNDNEQFLEKM